MKRILSVIVATLMSASLLAVLAPPATAHSPAPVKPPAHAPHAAAKAPVPVKAAPAPAPAKAATFAATGARYAVLDKSIDTLFLVNPDGTLDRSFPVVDGNRLTPVGMFRVSQEMAVNFDATKSGEAGIWRLDDFTRFNGGIGFHRLPVNKVTGKPMHSESALGKGTRLVSHGCVRMAAAAAKYLQRFVTRGTVVMVVDRR